MAKTTTPVEPGNQAPEYDTEAANMIKQGIADYLATLPVAARAASELYFRQVLPRMVVLASPSEG